MIGWRRSRNAMQSVTEMEVARGAVLCLPEGVVLWNESDFPAIIAAAVVLCLPEGVVLWNSRALVTAKSTGKCCACQRALCSGTKPRRSGKRCSIGVLCLPEGVVLWN